MMGKTAANAWKNYAVGQCNQTTKNPGRTLFVSFAEKTGNIYFFCLHYFEFYSQLNRRWHHQILSDRINRKYIVISHFRFVDSGRIDRLKGIALRDKVNNRIDVEKCTQAPILGEIGHSDDESLVVLRNSRRFVAEQFRILRSNLKYMTVKKENPSILVTSSFSGEGKSFISINMASVLALSGKKTVIMEMDIRKPKVMESLGMKRKMGITNYIIGRAQFKDIVMQVPGFESTYMLFPVDLFHPIRRNYYLIQNWMT